MSVGRKKDYVSQVRELAKKSYNKQCATCRITGIHSNVCFDFASFVCTRCAGLHREFGHKIRSIGMTTFSNADYELFAAGGNKRLAKTYLAKLPEDHKFEKQDNAQIKQFIKAAFVEKRWFGEKKKKSKKPRKTFSEPSTPQASPAGSSVGSGVASKQAEPAQPQPTVQVDMPDMLSGLGEIEWGNATQPQQTQPPPPPPEDDNQNQNQNAADEFANAFGPNAGSNNTTSFGTDFANNNTSFGADFANNNNNNNSNTSFGADSSSDWMNSAQQQQPTTFVSSTTPNPEPTPAQVQPTPPAPTSAFDGMDDLVDSLSQQNASESVHQAARFLVPHIHAAEAQFGLSQDETSLVVKMAVQLLRSGGPPPPPQQNTFQDQFAAPPQIQRQPQNHQPFGGFVEPQRPPQSHSPNPFDSPQKPPQQQSQFPHQPVQQHQPGNNPFFAPTPVSNSLAPPAQPHTNQQRHTAPDLYSSQPPQQHQQPQSAAAVNPFLAPTPHAPPQNNPFGSPPRSATPDPFSGLGASPAKFLARNHKNTI